MLTLGGRGSAHRDQSGQISPQSKKKSQKSPSRQIETLLRRLRGKLNFV